MSGFDLYPPGWTVPQGYHTEEECQRLGQICSKKKKKTEVPQAFYKAFENKEDNHAS